MKRKALLICAAALGLSAPGCGDEGGEPSGPAGTGAGASSGDAGQGGAGAGSGGAEPGAGGGGAGAAAWQVVLDQGDLDGVVLSAWGSGPGDVYAVGGPLGNSGVESLVVHFDGESFRRLTPGGAETYWWVGGSGADDVWMVGEEGRITRWDGAMFTEHASGTSATLFGVWAAAPDRAWAVGGTPGHGPGEDDVVLRWDGASWAPEALPGAPLGRALFKVWGASEDDLYVVGEAGVMWRRQGGAWALLPALTDKTLFTVAGCSASEVYAVGGQSVLRSNGQGFVKEEITPSNAVNGVACGPAGSALLVGVAGMKQRLVGGQWLDDFVAMPWDDLHGAWADGQGAFWAVGGDFYTQPGAGPRRGVVARFGSGTLAGESSP